MLSTSTNSINMLAVFALFTLTLAYQPCPLIKAYYPPPTIPHDLTTQFNKSFTNLVTTGTSKYGDISPNTTSFSVVFFSGDAKDSHDPTIFEFHHGAKSTITRDTKFLTGDLTQVLTVYQWLVEMGDGRWNTPITHFLPDLKSSTIPWEDITIGSLAGQLSGLSRTTGACRLNAPCKWNNFKTALNNQSPVFLPSTTPIISHTAFQLLSFAIQKHTSHTLNTSVFHPLKMSSSSLLGCDVPFNANLSLKGEPAALSVVTTTSDLARFGNAILSSRQLSPSTTRRWLSSSMDTSNIRNGVGRPWQIYRAGGNDAILDTFTLNGVVGPFASYFGIVPDFNVGFAILAYDAHVVPNGLDLNVYADVASDAIESLQGAAAKETALRFSGIYSNHKATANISIARDGPGLVVTELTDATGKDIIAKYASKLNIKRENIDFKLYPSNVVNKATSQWVMVFQDKSELADQGTPTCITWQTVGAAVPWQVVFEVGDKGATALSIPDEGLHLRRSH